MGYIGVITYNPLTNHLLTSWDIQAGGSHPRVGKNKVSSLKPTFSHLNMDRLEYDRFDWKGCWFLSFRGQKAYSNFQGCFS